MRDRARPPLLSTERHQHSTSTMIKPNTIAFRQIFQQTSSITSCHLTQQHKQTSTHESSSRLLLLSHHLNNVVSTTLPATYRGPPLPWSSNIFSRCFPSSASRLLRNSRARLLLHPSPPLHFSPASGFAIPSLACLHPHLLLLLLSRANLLSSQSLRIPFPNPLVATLSFIFLGQPLPPPSLFLFSA